eukprot:jgi/Mesvir1/16599/Mv10134-RA.1
MALRLQHDISERSLETATKADLCALIADEMIENVTRAVCIAELARHADSKTRLALAASSLSKEPFDSLAEMSREALCVMVGSLLTPEQRAAGIQLNCGEDMLASIPWREIGKSGVQSSQQTPCTPKCLVDSLHFIVTMLCAKSKKGAVLDRLPLVSKVALTPAAVWNAVAAMGGADNRQPDRLQAVLRGMVGAKTVDEAKRSQGGDAALKFLSSHATGQMKVGGTSSPCTAAVLRRHSVRSACLQKFLKSNRSRVYDDHKSGAPSAHPKSHAVGSACVLRLNGSGKSACTSGAAHKTRQAPVVADNTVDAQIHRLLYTANPSSRVGNVAAITLCG